MDIEIFALCDAATDTYGKLNLLGAFDTLMTRDFPVAHPQCAIAVRIRFRRIESGQHRMVLHLVSEDGAMVVPPMDGTITINVPPTENSAVANLILQMQNLHFERSGEYAINLAIDGRQVASLPLIVRALPTE
jgi:hypothetical protein